MKKNRLLFFKEGSYLRMGLFLLSFLCSLMIIGNSKGQSKTLDIPKIDIHLENVTVLEVFKEIERKTDYSFTYNDAYFDENQRLSVNFTQKSLSEVLDYVSSRSNFKYKIINKNIHIALAPKMNKTGQNIINTQKTEKTLVPIKGKVIDKLQGEPLIGATIVVKGTSKGTVTDVKGEFSLEVEDLYVTLIVSSVGYKTMETSLNGSNSVTITMEEDIAKLEEIIVIGYGTQKKEDVTGSVVSVNTEAISKMATNDISKAIQGQVAGVQITSSGDPGSAPQITIRGVGSFGGTAPLYIVDGIQTPINDLPTADVESIQVLKDASAAAIYGSRAANGVVIITTKRGQKGKLTLDYKAYYGVQNIARRFDVANREEYQLLVNEASVNAGVALKPANDPSSQLFVNNVDTDWQKEAFKTGKIQEHTLGVSGGNDMATYNISLNYFDQTGTIVGKGPNYTRYAFRVNTDFKQGRFKFGESFNYMKIDQQFMTSLHTGTSMIYILNAIPTIPVHDPNTIDGYSSASQTIHGSYTANAIGFNNLIESKTQRFRTIGNIYGEYEIIDGLTFKTSLSYERIDYRDLYFQPEHDLGWFYVNNIAKMNDRRGSGSTAILENTLTYGKVIGKHDFTIMGGNTILESNVSSLNGHAEGFTKPYYMSINRGTSGVSVTGGQAKNRMLSYFGRLIYNFDNKYMLQATIRRDGSSRFGKDFRWGVFPSVAMGWKIHNESFMKNLSFISQMKLRASYGVLGNQEIGNYLYEAFINPYAHAVFGNQLAVGATQINPATNDIRWESKKTSNIGFDFGFLKDKITFTAEYYQSTASDLLIRVRIPESTGVYPWESPVVNGASMRNSGFEFQLGYKDTKGDFSYSFNANMSTYKNEVLSLGYGDNPIFGGLSKTEVGGQISQLYGYVIEGIFKSQEEVDAVNANAPGGIYQVLATSPGDIKFKDLNKDGVITADDREYLGRAYPNLYFGFNVNVAYKGFDLSILASGVSGNMIFNGLRASLEGGGGWDNYSKNMLNRWTPQNTSTDVPRVVMFDPNSNGRASARWLENGSYLKLTNVQLGYNFPVNMISKVGLSKARVYLTGQNLFNITKYTGFDPDFAYNGIFDRAIDQGSYANRDFTAFQGGLPNPRSFMMGLQLSF